jgi:hypothetical protein
MARCLLSAASPRRRRLENGNFPHILWITLGKECQKAVAIGRIGRFVTDWSKIVQQ